VLHHFSKELIQQFLDELVWRERVGQIAAYAYNNLIKNLAEITRSHEHIGVVKFLEDIAKDPGTVGNMPRRQYMVIEKVCDDNFSIVI